MKLPNYPATRALPELKAHFNQGRNAVLAAPPGSGKTTVVPLGLLDEPWLINKKILMLQPRRIAARSCASRMAELVGERPGQTIGYSIRFEQRVSSATRIEVLTEGLLCRRLQDDAELAGVGLVIFDEFHERSLDAELAMALTLDAKEQLSPELRLLVMSATMDVQAVVELLGEASIVAAGGKMFPVSLRYTASTRDEQLEDAVTRVTRSAMNESEGDVLVFLPGVREIERCRRKLESSADRSFRVLPLHGSLAAAQQDEAIRPGPGNAPPKVILATNIAQTSLTVPGVTTVVDSGLERVASFDLAAGNDRLETRRISRASAEQRAGRSGRLGPGTAYRLWTRDQEGSMPAFDAPEVRRADLCRLALELAVWGVQDPQQLKWLDAPGGALWDYAIELLGSLGAIDRHGRCTPHGRRLGSMPIHPRLAHLMIGAAQNGQAVLGAQLAASLDIRPQNDVRDISRHLGHLLAATASDGQARNFRRSVDQFQKLLTRFGAAAAADGHVDAQDSIGVLTGLAFPERIARRRATGERASSEVAYLCVDGGEARLNSSDPLAQNQWLAIAHWTPGSQRKIRLAAALREEDIRQSQAHQIEQRSEIQWSVKEKKVIAESQSRLGAIILSNRPLNNVEDQIAEAMLEGVRQMGIECLPWTDASRQWQARVYCLGQWRPEDGWPDVSDTVLMQAIETWLLPFLSGISRESHLGRLDLPACLESFLDYPQSRQLDALAPKQITVPSGQKRNVHYIQDGAPVLKVKLQEMFGCRKTPSICEGKIPLQLHLLSPAQRPLAVTQDLEGFWDGPYKEVRKELRGRYPKHPWPEDPRSATATHKAKPRKH